MPALRHVGSLPDRSPVVAVQALFGVLFATIFLAAHRQRCLWASLWLPSTGAQWYWQQLRGACGGVVTFGQAATRACPPKILAARRAAHALRVLLPWPSWFAVYWHARRYALACRARVPGRPMPQHTLLHRRGIGHTASRVGFARRTYYLPLPSPGGMRFKGPEEVGQD